MTAVLAQPVLQVEEVELLGPEHARQRLAVNPALILAQRLRGDPVVELVGLGDAPRQSRRESAKCVVGRVTSQAKTDGLAPAAGHLQHVVGGGLGSGLGGVDRIAVSRDDVRVEGVLDVGRGIGLAPETAGVALVLGEEQLRAPSQDSRYSPSSWCEILDDPGCRFTKRGLRLGLTPGPRVPEPERRQHPKPGGFRTAIVHGDVDEDVFRAFLRVLDEDVEVPVFAERRPYRAARTRTLPAIVSGWSRPGRRKGTPAAGTCTDTSCRSASACCRGRSSTP